MTFVQARLYFDWFISVFSSVRPKILSTKYFAHRGLYNNSGSAPENTMAAFRRAVKAGYGIELDIQLTKDGKVVVTHDFHLKRNCGISGDVDQFNYEELGRFPVFHSEERIPLLEDVLKLVDGKVPLLVEIKLPTLNTYTCQAADALLQNYSGKYCIESFNPLALRWYKKHRKDVVRGQLSANLTKPVTEAGFLLSFLVKYLLLNFIGRPDFIAYCYTDTQNVSFLLNKCLLHTPTFAWTVRSQTVLEKYRNKFDSIIFDGFVPAHKHSV